MGNCFGIGFSAYQQAASAGCPLVRKKADAAFSTMFWTGMLIPPIFKFAYERCASETNDDAPIHQIADAMSDGGGFGDRFCRANKAFWTHWLSITVLVIIVACAIGLVIYCLYFKVKRTVRDL